LALYNCQIVLSEERHGHGHVKRWATLKGDIFINEYAKPTSGKQNFTGLTPEGQAQYDVYLEQSEAARADKDKRAIEKAHLNWLRPEMDIECDSYSLDLKRKNRKDGTEGIAQDTAEELAFDDTELFGESDSDSETGGLFD